jgi:hypothetical protein
MQKTQPENITGRKRRPSEREAPGVIDIADKAKEPS